MDCFWKKLQDQGHSTFLSKTGFLCHWLCHWNKRFPFAEGSQFVKWWHSSYGHGPHWTWSRLECWQNWWEDEIHTYLTSKQSMKFMERKLLDGIFKFLKEKPLIVDNFKKFPLTPPTHYSHRVDQCCKWELEYWQDCIWLIYQLKSEAQENLVESTDSHETKETFNKMLWGKAHEKWHLIQDDSYMFQQDNPYLWLKKWL